MREGILTANKNLTLIAAALSSFLGTFMGSSINIALPTIGKDFNMSAVSLSWAATVYLMAAAIFLVPFGKLADMVGRKKVFLYGMIIYITSSVLIALSTSGIMLILCRVVEGTGSSMIFATGMAILLLVFPPEKRGLALGISVGSVYLGLSLGPVVGGFITQHFGWRYIFWLNLPLGSIVAFLIAFGVHGDWVDNGQLKFDYIGSASLGLSLVSMIFGLSKLPAALGIIMAASGLALFIFFIIYESRIPKPLIDIAMFRNNPVFAFSNLAALINYSTTAGVSFLLSLYLQYIKGMSPREAGMIMVSQPIVMTIFAPIAGKLSDKIQPRTVASIGMGMTLAGLLLLISLRADSSLPFIISCMGFLGFGIALFSSPNTNAVMSAVDKSQYGVASAIVGTMRLIGQMISMSVVMLIFALMFGKVKITPEYYPYLIKSARIAFIVFAGLCFIGIFASLARGKITRPHATLAPSNPE